MPLSGRAGFAGSGVCTAGRERVDARSARERRRLRCRFQAVPALPARASAPLAGSAGMRGRRVKAAVVGGGLAGLAAALELVDAGHEVTLYEARPSLGGAVQTLPERDGDPSPPPDNGQHIALGCFTEYLAFLDRIGEGASYVRQPLQLPVIGEDGRRADIAPSLRTLLAYAHVPLRDRLRIPVTTARCRNTRAR